MLPKIFKNFKNLILAISKKRDGNLKNDENARKKFLDKFNLSFKNLIFLKQIHSKKIILIKKRKGIPRVGDGMITKEKGVVPGVFSADCLPIFIFDQKREIIGLLHAGWKGSLKGIAKEAIKILKKEGSNPKDVLVYIGPSISGKCYEVPKERAEIFSKKFQKFKSKIIKQRGEKYFLDLRKLNKLIFIEEGVLPKNIQISKICTFCNKNYFSFRRKGENLNGEMLSIFCKI